MSWRSQNCFWGFRQNSNNSKKNVVSCGNQESKESDGEAPPTTAWANSTLICWEDFSVSILYLNIVSGDEDGNYVHAGGCCVVVIEAFIYNRSIPNKTD